MKPNLVLVGFMGSGKTTVGRLLARRLHMRFVDVDLLIEKQEGCTIDVLFQEKGEEYFRKQETEMIRTLSQEQGAVISTGGGVVMRSENLKILQSIGWVVLLKVDAQTAYERTRGKTTRPLLKNEDPRKRIEEILQSRSMFYDQIVDQVNTVGRSCEEVVEEIVISYQEKFRH